MLKKFFIYVFTLLPHTVWALNCDSGDFKLVLTTDTSQIPFDESLQNSAPDISSLCLNDQENETFDRQKNGSHCWCHINSLHGYPISATWKHTKQYKSHKFNEERLRNKKNITETEIEKQREETFRLNAKDCATKCPALCTNTVIEPTINGYYICDHAQYKMGKSQCMIDQKIVDAENIRVFNDIAELITKRIQIVFKRDTTNTKEITYIGEYENKPINLTIKDGKIYLGREWFSMEKCIAK